jgi:hypothetical protein
MIKPERRRPLFFHSIMFFAVSFNGLVSGQWRGFFMGIAAGCLAIRLIDFIFGDKTLGENYPYLPTVKS